MLVQAAMALWRTKGYATTTVAEICTAAGVSKALFYFYFPRKEDVLFEVGVLSTQSAQRAIHRLLSKPYEVEAVIGAALTAFEESMARNPPELIVETILEGYRHEHRLMADGTPPDLDADMFSELFARACADGKIAADMNDKDVVHLAYLAQTMVSEGARHWAAGAFGDRSFAAVVTADICTLIDGYTARRPHVGFRDRP